MAGVHTLVLVNLAHTILAIIWVPVLGKIWDTVKEKFWDTVLGNIFDTVLGKIGDYVVTPIWKQFSYICFFNSNIKELETQMEKLRTTRQGVQRWVDDERSQLRDIGSDVEAWRKSANEVTIEVEGIIQQKPRVKEGWCLNLKLRYSLSRKAVENTKVVVNLQADGVQYTKSSFCPTHTCTETIPNKNFTAFKSRRLPMENIIKALTDDKINLIGVCGLPGVGKTTMVKEVAKRAKEDGIFVEVASASVGQKPNIANVQACIADMLGLKELGDRASPEVKADLLRKRLLQDDKKILVILDDIWEEIDLEDMGIPLGRANKNLKMLYTSRTRYLWHNSQTKEEIHLQALSEDEAWQLFKEKVGDSADARDLQPIAKQIVNECGRLPLALVLIGSALSKKSGRNVIEIWKSMLDRLTCATSNPVDERLSSRLELSFEYLDNKEAKRLFLLCCLFKEDEDIRIEDLARYGVGLSLFDGINEMRKVRSRVFLIVDDLKSRYLLLDGVQNCVKVHDVVRDMGIFIASKDKYALALVSHGAASGWPKKDTYEHYAAISVISRTITELPQGLACPNLQLLILMLERGKLKKPLRNFFEGMGKLKVLELNHFDGVLKLQSLTNLRTLSLENYCGDVVNNVSGFGSLFNLEILSFRYSWIEELPEELGELVNLKLLDLQHTVSLKRIPPGVISRLVHLEELYVVESKFNAWEGEGKEEEGRNANLREFGSLSKLNTLQIIIRAGVLLPKDPIFSKLKIYLVKIGHMDDLPDSKDDTDDNSIYYMAKQHERGLAVLVSNPIPLDRGGIDTLLRNSDFLFLHREGCNNLVQELLRNGVDVLQQLKFLLISRCDTPECLVNTMKSVHLPTPAGPAIAVFPILQTLVLNRLANLREICRVPVPTPSFAELNRIIVKKCGSLGSLFQLPIVGCLTQLEYLTIASCSMMEEVFIWKEQRGDVHVATNGKIEFPKLRELELEELQSLLGFCRGIDQIDFPQLESLELRDLGQLNRLFHNNNRYSNSEQNGDVGFHYLFPQKVSLPSLKVLQLAKLENLERLGDDPLPVGSLSQLKQFSVSDCDKLLCAIPSQLLWMLRDLQNLKIECCKLLEVVFESEGVGYNEPNPEILPPLELVKLHNLPKLNYISKRDPMCFKYIQALAIDHCNRLRYVFSPTMTQSIPQLRTLKISRCEMLSRIVAKKNELGEPTVDVVEFPHLEWLELYDLPNLVSFFPDMNTTSLEKSTDHYHNPLQPQPLFNKKVTIPSLKYLELSGLENVSDLWGSELPTGSFSELKMLNVRYCASLRNMFHPFMARDLLNLQNLFISYCSNLEAVVGKEEQVGGHRRKMEKTLFPELGRLRLDSLPNLRRFCHFTHPFEIPLLSEVDILDCPNMDAFSLEPVSAPNLSLPDKSWKGDLKNAIPLLQGIGREKENKKRELENLMKEWEARREEWENRRKEWEKEKEDVDMDKNEDEDDQEEVLDHWTNEASRGGPSHIGLDDSFERVLNALGLTSDENNVEANNKRAGTDLVGGSSKRPRNITALDLNLDLHEVTSLDRPEETLVSNENGVDAVQSRDGQNTMVGSFSHTHADGSFFHTHADGALDSGHLENPTGGDSGQHSHQRAMGKRPLDMEDPSLEIAIGSTKKQRLEEIANCSTKKQSLEDSRYLFRDPEPLLSLGVVQNLENPPAMEPKKGSEKEGKGKNFRWSKPMQSLLLEILADEATKGNKPSNTFRPGSFARVAKEITQKYGVECQSKHVENRLKTIKSTWKIISDLRYMKSGFGWDDNLRMITCGETVFDEYIAAHPEHEAFLNKKIEMYDEMALVVGKDMATVQFAKSFDDIEEETVAESDSIDFGVAEVSKGKCTTSSSEAPTQARPHRKRSRDEDEGYDKLSAQIGEVALAIKTLSDDRLDVKDLYAEVMKTEGFDELTLASAFDHLVENEKVAKAFMVKSARLRRAWLEGFFNMNA